MTSAIKNIIRKSWIPLVVVLLLAGWQAWRFYQRVFGPAVIVSEQGGSALLYIPTGSTFSVVCDSLVTNAWIADSTKFRWVAQRKDYVERVRPGRYRISHGMSYNALVNMLRAGAQEPVKLVVRPFRNLKDLSTFLGEQLEPDASEFYAALRDEELLSIAGLSAPQAMLLVIPNTYEVWWTINTKGFMERMVAEHKRFWTDGRREKAQQLNLDPVSVSILASIVQEETNKRDEMSRIAGVYHNRLKIGMLLQADPTVKFALGNPAIRRILYRHLEVDSPYNTYRHTGLPPGPIAMPEIFVIDAVLNAEKHDYYFFCARDDLSGYHAFARTGTEHARNARNYQRALNKQGLY